MDRIIENLFRRKKVNFGKSEEYGFIKQDNNYIYKTEICDDQMRLTVTIDAQGTVSTEVYDLQSNDEYTLFLVEDAVGGFVGQTRTEYENVLSDVAEKCFEQEIFKSEYTKKVIKYVAEKYGDELEYLWEKFPENAVWRRRDNNKWYGIIMTVQKRKLGICAEGIVEIIDLRMSEDKLTRIADDKLFYPAYHMNKRHWITICLDGSLDIEEIYPLIDESYILALKNKSQRS